jgi:hypothetical protein
MRQEKYERMLFDNSSVRGVQKETRSTVRRELTVLDFRRRG